MGEVLFEFVQVGQLMRVAAIDVDTGMEVVIMAPLQVTREQMQTVALAKLRTRLGRASTQDRHQAAPPGHRSHVMDRKV